MRNAIGVALLFVLAMALFAIVFGGLPYAGYLDGYQQGQIDAVNGRVYYQLRRTSSGGAGWVELDKPTTQPFAVEVK